MLQIEFKSKDGNEGLDPINVAKALVNHGAWSNRTFSADELEAIGEHLLIESKHMRKATMPASMKY